MKRLKFKLFLLLIAIFCVTNCSSLFFGNIKPIEEKSTTYTITNPTQLNSDWVQIESNSAITPTTQGKWAPDATFQSIQTAAIIYINSVCKSYTSQDSSLKNISKQLTLGISDIQIEAEGEILLSGIPAWQTTFTGKTDENLTKFRTIVLKKGTCTYDLIYLSQPQFFLKHLHDFSQFSKSLKIQ